MAIALVNSSPITPLVNGASVAASFAVLPTPGNTLIAVLGRYHATTGHTVTVDDNQDHGWAEAVTKVINPSGDDLGADIWWKAVGTSAGTYTVTVTPSAGNFWASLTVLEYSGLAAAPVDRTATGIATSGNPIASGTTAATTQADELLVACLSLYSSNTAAMGVTGGWAEEVVGEGAWGVAGKQVFSMVDRVVAAMSTYVHTWTADHEDYGAALIATFKQYVPPAATTVRTITVAGLG